MLSLPDRPREVVDNALPKNPIILIPARLAARRLPGKPLADIAGTAMIIHVWRRAVAAEAGPVVVACGDREIAEIVEAAGGRAGLRSALERSRIRFFGDAKRGPRPFTFEEMRAIFSSQNSFFDRLKPATETQRALIATAKDQVRKLADTQMLMARQLASPFPPYVLAVVVCWASALFLGNGLVAPPNAVSVLAHLAGAIAIATAIFLILELSSPYTGLIRLSPAGIDRVLEILSGVDKKGAPE